MAQICRENIHLVSTEEQTPRCPSTFRAVVMEFRSGALSQRFNVCIKYCKLTRQNDSFARALDGSTPNSPSLRFKRLLIVHNTVYDTLRCLKQLELNLFLFANKLGYKH